MYLILKISDKSLFIINDFFFISILVFMFLVLMNIYCTNVLDLAEEEEDEDMMIEWFYLVNEKNELVRKEADLIYM